MYHVNPDHKEREFLTLDELTAMTEIKLEDPNMAFARDLFIFGSWTGIAFIDIKNLTEDNISMVNGAPWQCGSPRWNGEKVILVVVHNLALLLPF